MAMGIVSNDDFNSELGKLNPVQINEIVKDINHGRGNVKEVPESLRKIISEEALEGTKSKDIQQAFGVSASSISAYKKGSHSTSNYNEGNKELRDHNRIIKERIIGKARKHIVRALDAITPEKLEDTKAVELANIAKSMSSVIKNLEPEVPLIHNENKVMIFRPRMREEDEYEVIDVTE